MMLVSFVLAFAVQAASNEMSQPCPGCRNCNCNTNTNKTDINCLHVYSMKDLQDVQSLIKTHFQEEPINKLTLYDCTVNVIPRDFLGNASVSQFISYCPLNQVEENTFADVQDLLKIIVRNSIFSRIPIGLQYAPPARSILINDGSLESLTDELHRLTELNYVILSHNLLRTISRDAFIRTPRIVHLDLSGNKLEVIPEGTFDPLVSLRQILLTENNLLTLNGAFKKLYPEKVDISSNKLTIVDDAFQDGTTSIKSLVISKNPLELSKLYALGKKATSITSLDISACQLKVMDSKVFLQFSFLRELRATTNGFTELPKELFKQLKALQEVELYNNKFESVRDAFNGLPYLKKLSLFGNKIKSIENSFINISSLQELTLHRNKLTSLPKGIFEGTTKLRNLHLSNNLISRLDKDVFLGLDQLERLYMSSNKFTILNDSVGHLRTLRKLTLKKGHLVTLSETDFYGLHNIVELDLSENKLVQVNEAFRGLRSLKSLNLAKNKLRTLSRDSFPEDMEITELYLAGGNKWECDCRLLWLLEWYQETEGAYLKDHPICHNSQPRLYLKFFRNLTISDLVDWPENCPETCTCRCRPYRQIFYVEVDCADRNLLGIPQVLPDHLGALFLNNNSLPKLHLDNDTDIQHLRILDLSNSRLEQLDGQLPGRLKVLNLNGNRLKRIPDIILEAKNLEEVTLSRNPWICDCDTREFRRWLLSSADKIIDVNDTRCGQDQQNGVLLGKVITSLTDNDLCPSKIKLYVAIALGTLSLLFVCASIGLAYFRYQLNLKVWLYSHGITWVKENENDDNKIFDALLSCSDDDLQFGLSVIVSGLEKEKPYFNVFVPDRDMMLGGNEIVDTLNAVSQCRRVIVILSRSFLQDEFRMEVFRSAFAVFLEEKIRRIIVIQYGELPPKCEMDPSLKAMLESSDTLRWQEKNFWSRLRYAMPKKTEKTDRSIIDDSTPECQRYI